MKSIRNLLGKSRDGKISPAGLAMAAASLLALSMGLAACENVAGYTRPSLVRFIDGSYIAPAVNVYITSGTSTIELASNLGQGAITNYGTVSASADAQVKITEVTADVTLVKADVTILGGHQHSIFLTDNGSTTNSYTVTVLEDQQVAAASGHSAFRFLNQAPKVGAIDVYMIPAGSSLAKTNPMVSNLPVGQTFGYTLFNAETVTMVIVAHGTTTPKYTSSSLALTGGEVRTVLVFDSQLTSDPPVYVTVADDYD